MADSIDEGPTGRGVQREGIKKKAEPLLTLPRGGLGGLGGELLNWAKVRGLGCALTFQLGH